MEFIKKQCSVCGNERKFVKESNQDLMNVCGECWSEIVKIGWRKR